MTKRPPRVVIALGGYAALIAGFTCAVAAPPLDRLRAECLARANQSPAGPSRATDCYAVSRSTASALPASSRALPGQSRA